MHTYKYYFLDKRRPNAKAIHHYTYINIIHIHIYIDIYIYIIILLILLYGRVQQVVCAFSSTDSWYFVYKSEI